MRFEVENIKNDVRIVMDENRADAYMQYDIDTLNINDIIESKIEDAAKMVMMEAPTYLLETDRSFFDKENDQVVWPEDDPSAGYIVLPKDFMRLIAFKMSDWTKAVYKAILPTDPEYALQHSTIPGIRGDRYKPVCAIVQKKEGLALEFFSCDTMWDEVEMAIYQPMPKIQDGGIDISESCYRAVIYKTAALTMMAMRETEIANGLLEIANGLIK